MEGPSLMGSRNHYCLSEELVFTCTGPGTAIEWNVPSVLNDIGFIDFQNPPITTLIAGVDAAVHLNQSMPTFITTLTIRGIPDITVMCSTDDPVDQMSTTPPFSSKQCLYGKIMEIVTITKKPVYKGKTKRIM